MFAKLRAALVASVFILAVASLTGCAGEDRRLAADQESCRNMGHAAGTPEFRQCMTDLNERRGAVQKAKAGAGSHIATADCTRLP